jgi:hypothetical protein
MFSQQLLPLHSSVLIILLAHCPAKLHRAASALSGPRFDPKQPPEAATFTHSSIKSFSTVSSGTAEPQLLNTDRQLASAALSMFRLKEGGSLLAHAASSSALSCFACFWH